MIDRLRAAYHRFPDAFPLLALALVVFVVYGRHLGYDFLVFCDDNGLVLSNDVVHGFSWGHLRAAFGPTSLGQYNPLTMISYMLDYTLWGLRPGGYHLSNIVVHLLNGILFYSLLQRLHGDRLLCLVAAAIFLLHPVQVESVAWISERKGLLATLFILVALQQYCIYGEAAAGERRMAYLLSLTAFVLSLLAKPVAVILPVILVLYDHCFPGTARRFRWLDKLPFALCAIACALITMQSEMPASGGARVGYHGGNPLATLFTMVPVFCTYLKLLVWPVDLSVEYAPTIYKTLNAPVIGAALFLAFIFLAGIRLYRTDRRLAFWSLFFWIGLLPVSQIIPTVIIMFDHYLYIPMMGGAALAGAGVVFLRNHLRKKPVVFLYAPLTLLVLALAVASFQRGAVWRNSLTLWSDAVTKAPQAFRAWLLYGETLLSMGKKEDALRAFEKALDAEPATKGALWYTGSLYTEQGSLDKGYAKLTKLLELYPDHVMGWVALGNNYLLRGNYDRAEEMYQRALALQPEAMEILTALGNLAMIRNNLGLARTYFGQVEATGGDNPDNAFRMACLEAQEANIEASVTWLLKALQRGYRNYHELNSNKFLENIWNDPRFAMFMLQYFPDQSGQ